MWVVGIHESGGHGVRVCVGVGVHTGVIGRRFLFAGGRSLLSVDGASLWRTGGRCAWGCQCRPSALWAGVCGVVEKAIIDVAHLDGCATSAAWWWASLLSLVVPRLLGIHR